MTRATLEPIARNLAIVRARMQAAAEQAGRDPASVQLLAVAKACPAAAIAAAYTAGQMEFGENYLQEALPKLEALKHHSGLIWHFIGALQSNKTRLIAEHFDWVHTVDRERIAQRLSEQRPATLPSLNICIEVRLGDEPGKSGLMPETVAALAKYIAALPRLRLRGLMCIPPPAGDVATQRIGFRHLRELFDVLNHQGHELDTLSMGMSGDFEAAILEGSTLVRVGTAIFGTRPRKHS
ncbi:MAG TPA: YggS family pyridoxal phosphate-dependent enzyme [Gammaproteobacteria bacterium]|nr:YggS family pyridoxal phosphate-dependent enzyme [Gammaproteobacteria bacterium]